MTATCDPLVFDLVQWVAREPRTGREAQDLAATGFDVGGSTPGAPIAAGRVRRFRMESCRMTSALEHRRPLPTDSEAILNALPNPVLLVAPDGRIVDANIAAESFFEISTQFLRRQSLKELVPFGSPLLALIEQVRASNSPVNEYKVDLGTPRIGGWAFRGLLDLPVAWDVNAVG